MSSSHPSGGAALSMSSRMSDLLGPGGLYGSRLSETSRHAVGRSPPSSQCRGACGARRRPEATRAPRSTDCALARAARWTRERLRNRGPDRGASSDRARRSSSGSGTSARIAAAQIAAPARVHEDRVPRKDASIVAFDLPAGRPRRVTGRVQGANAQGPHSTASPPATRFKSFQRSESSSSTSAECTWMGTPFHASRSGSPFTCRGGGG